MGDFLEILPDPYRGPDNMPHSTPAFAGAFFVATHVSLTETSQPLPLTSPAAAAAAGSDACACGTSALRSLFPTADGRRAVHDAGAHPGYGSAPQEVQVSRGAPALLGLLGRA